MVKITTMGLIGIKYQLIYGLALDINVLNLLMTFTVNVKALGWTSIPDKKIRG